MPLERIAAYGWHECLRLANEHAQLTITTEVGPRIIDFRTSGGENVLRTFPEQMGTSGEPDYQVRGGHRLWVSPETDLTYAPDNSPVDVQELNAGSVRLINEPKERAPLRKTLTVSLSASASVELEHALTNESGASMEIASWAITVMRPGGWEIIPQPPLGSHDTDLLPRRVVVPWTYTDFSDPRWRFGTRYWRLTPTAGQLATKMGFALPSGWAAYALPDALFVKTFPYEESAPYPDLGCNFETFSKDEFIELESLSPSRRLAPGETVSHRETWHLLADSAPSAAVDDAALAAWLQPRLEPLGLR